MVSLTWFFLHPSTLYSKFFNHHFSLFLFSPWNPLFSSPKTPLGCVSLVGHIIGRDEGRGNRLLRHPRGHLYDIETEPGSSKWPLKKVVNMTLVGVKWPRNGAWKVDRVRLGVYACVYQHVATSLGGYPRTSGMYPRPWPSRTGLNCRSEQN